MKISKPSIAFWQKLILLSIGSVNLFILLLFLGIWRTSDRTLNFIGNLFTGSTTEPQVETFTPILQRIQSIQELSTTVQTMETIVPTSVDRK